MIGASLTLAYHALRGLRCAAVGSAPNEPILFAGLWGIGASLVLLEPDATGWTILPFWVVGLATSRPWSASG